MKLILIKKNAGKQAAFFTTLGCGSRIYSNTNNTKSYLDL
jgi:hypothetical protein